MPPTAIILDTKRNLRGLDVNIGKQVRPYRHFEWNFVPRYEGDNVEADAEVGHREAVGL